MFSLLNTTTNIWSEGFKELLRGAFDILEQRCHFYQPSAKAPFPRADKLFYCAVKCAAHPVHVHWQNYAYCDV